MEVVFLFSGQCLFCQRIAQTVKRLGERYEVNIRAISADGTPLLAFPRAKRRGRFLLPNVTGIPALFSGGRRAADRRVVGVGQMSLGEILDRIQIATGCRPRLRRK